MKDLLVITSLFITCCLNPKDTESIEEYFKWNEMKVHEYICRPTDSTMMRIFVYQNLKQLPNETSELEFVLKRVDSFPISKGIERYYPSNQFELISHSLFELDSQNKPIEIKAQIIKGGRKSIDDTLIEYDLLYKFRVDSASTLHLNSRLYFHFQFIDSLENKCLLVSSMDKLYFHYDDSRHDTTLLSESSRIYAKGKGLIYFELGNIRKKIFYKLKQ